MAILLFFFASDAKLPMALELLLTIMTTVCMLLGKTVLLTLVLAVKSLRRRPHVFVASLAVCNILLGIQKFFIIAVRCSEDFWVPNWLCQLDGTVLISCVNGESSSLIGIAISRYIKICHSHTYRWLFSTRKMVCMLLGLCAGSIGLGVLPMRPGWQYIFDECVIVCLFDRDRI